MKVLVCGDRNWMNRARIFEILKELPKDSIIIQGGCTGVDMLAKELGKKLGFNVETFSADWASYGKAAGPIRNQQMLDEGKPDVVYAFHNNIAGSRGTKDMVDRAKRSGLKVEVFTERSSD